MQSFQNLLFLDVETVSGYPHFTDLDDRGQRLWQQKIGYLVRQDNREWTPEDYAASYRQKAAIYAEFGKAIVISAGYLAHNEDGQLQLRIKSFYGHDERQVLLDFSTILNQKFNNPNLHVLCGHNIREFDMPYLCRRLLVNELPLPTLFQIAGKKPWEVKHVADTMEMWKFGDIKNYTSLDLLAYSLGIPSPKDQLDGSQVGEYYYEKDGLEDIRRYCERDVVTVAQVFLKFNQAALLQEEQIVVVE